MRQDEWHVAPSFPRARKQAPRSPVSFPCKQQSYRFLKIAEVLGISMLLCALALFIVMLFLQAMQYSPEHLSAFWEAYQSGLGAWLLFGVGSIISLVIFAVINDMYAQK